ncbi:MAG TPA: cytochrome c3 family protein [Rectinemataceae bacterium]|nr:cytochrome c3 family protein [Rectinemataceae bacterium]
MYKGFVIDLSLLNSDPHLSQGCTTCHKGDDKATDRTKAHSGLVKRPSDDPELCAVCHPDVAANYSLSLHYTTAGFKNGVRPRFSESEAAIYDKKVFEQSCRSCHASCGDCHVKSPTISGVDIGLLSGHKFVRKDEAKTCALCHGGRVYPEFNGDYGGNADVHYQKGMSCVDCHKAAGLHGNGVAYPDMRAVAEKPTCVGCHPAGAEASDKAKQAHAVHGDKVSCSACHSSAEYRGCSSCHLGEGATDAPMFVLGRNPRMPGQLTTLRLVPTVRDTFAKAGIAQANYDAVQNLWDSVPHNTKKRTDRTRDCATCHDQQAHFLTVDSLPVGGAEANKALIFNFRK